MKKITLFLATAALVLACTPKEAEWENLLEGNNLDKWHYFQDTGHKTGWIVENDVLTFNGVSDLEAGTGDASLISNASYGNFEIKFDWKVSPGANSGFMWGVSEDPSFLYPYQTGMEIQILDPGIYDQPENAQGGEVEVNNALEDLGARKHFVGALYDLSPPTDLHAALPAGEWNSYHITIDYENNHGEVVLNDKLVNSFPLYGPKWETLLAGSKFAQSEDSASFYLGDARWYSFGKFREGPICLQDHPGEVSFRNIFIRPL